MFDDESRDIKEVTFVAGADIMFDPRAGGKQTLRLSHAVLYSEQHLSRIMTYTVRLIGNDGHDGHYYMVEYFKMYRAVETFQFWLCPALLEFFDEAPEDIYVSIK